MSTDFDMKPTPKYSLLDSSETDQWLVKIEEGDYKDVVYKYKTVRCLETSNVEGYGTLQFTYDIVYDAEMSEHLTPTSVEFVTTIGDILYNMIVSKEDGEGEKK